MKVNRCIVFVQEKYLKLFKNTIAYTQNRIEIVRIYSLDDISDEVIMGFNVYKLDSVVEAIGFDIALLYTDFIEQVKHLVSSIYPDVWRYRLLSAYEMAEEMLTGAGKMHFLKHWIDMEYPRLNLPYVEIGDFTYFGKIDVMSEVRDGSVMCRIGKFCSIGPEFTVLLGEEHSITWNSTYPFVDFIPGFSKGSDLIRSKGDVVIGNDVWIGRNVMVLSGVEIGTGSVIGAGTVVTKSVEPYSVIVGNPGKVIKKRFSDKRIKGLLDSKWWDMPYDELYKMLPALMCNKEPTCLNA